MKDRLSAGAGLAPNKTKERALEIIHIYLQRNTMEREYREVFWERLTNSRFS